MKIERNTLGIGLRVSGRLAEGERIRFSGVDFGPCVIYKIIPQVTNGLIVIKRNGHNTWAGVGYTEYAPVEYYFVKIVSINDTIRTTDFIVVEGVKRISKEFDSILEQVNNYGK